MLRLLPVRRSVHPRLITSSGHHIPLFRHGASRRLGLAMASTATSSSHSPDIWTQVSTSQGLYDVFTGQIQKSQQDDREYKLIRLQNGLQAMLVHDAKADKAAASLDVAVGHLHDPVSSTHP